MWLDLMKLLICGCHGNYKLMGYKRWGHAWLQLAIGLFMLMCPCSIFIFLMKNESGEVQAAATFLLLIIFGLKENEFEIEKSVWPFFFFFLKKAIRICFRKLLVLVLFIYVLEYLKINLNCFLLICSCLEFPLESY